jgi:hypothetical protein
LGYFLSNEGFDVTIIHNGKKPPLVDLVFSNMLPSTSDINVTKETMRIYRNLEEEYGARFLKNYVALHIYPNLDSLKMVEPVIGDIEGAGVKVKVLDSKEAHEITGLRYGEQEYVIMGEYEYLVSIRRIIDILHRRLRIIHDNARLIIKDNKAIALTKNGELNADSIVLAAGGWNVEIARDAGLDLPLVNYGTRALLILGRTKLNKYSISDYTYDYYTRPMGNALDGIAFIAGDGNVKTNNLRRVKELTDGSYRNWLIGSMKKRDDRNMVSLIAGYGLVEMAYDYEPVIGKVGKVENLYLIGGLDGYGAKLGPGLAFELSRIIMGLKPTINISCYDIARFNEYDGPHDVNPLWEPVMLYLPAPNGGSPCFYKTKL